MSSVCLAINITDKCVNGDFRDIFRMCPAWNNGHSERSGSRLSG